MNENQIPIGLKLFLGNESKKLKIREVINELIKQNRIEGKIVKVLDKGLNCARNIFEARINKNGYLFSKSCKQLTEIEKTWLLLDNDYIKITNKECIDIFEYSFIDNNDKKVKFKVKKKRVATFNPSLAKKQLLEDKS